MVLRTVGSFWSSAKSHTSPYTLSERGKHLARTLRTGRFHGLREVWDQHESAYIRLLLGDGDEDESHDTRGYGIDVEALSGHGDPDFAHAACRDRMYGRKVLLTERGYFGLAGNIAKEGDYVGIILGTGTPFLLRSVGDKFQILADAYAESKSGGLLGREDGHLFLGGKDWMNWGLEEKNLVLV